MKYNLINNKYLGDSQMQSDILIRVLVNHRMEIPHQGHKLLDLIQDLPQL